MRIAGIYPQRIGADPKIQHAVTEPYGLEMILAVAKQEGHDVDLFMPVRDDVDGLTEIGEEEFVDTIDRFNPDVAALSMYTCQYPMGKRVAAELKKRRPSLITVGGNRYPTYMGDRIEDPFDFFVIKEGEETFRDLLEEIENGHDYGNVKGISFRKDGTPVFTGVRGRNFNLDSLPNAQRYPVVLKQVYRGISPVPTSANPSYAIVEYSRCCYNNCSFCDNAGFWGNKVTFRSPERVVDEMLELQEAGVDIFYFMDLNFTAFPNKTIELIGEMRRKGLKTSWYCMSNTNTAHGRPELLHAMKEAGCFKIAWGIESTSDASLDRMNKRVRGKLTTNEQTMEVLQSSIGAGLLNQGYYIIGFPWETEESIIRDAGNLKYLPIHQLNIGIFTPIPLSRFHSELLDQGCEIDPDLERHDRNHLVYKHNSLTNDSVKRLQSQIYRNFYQTGEYAGNVESVCRLDPRLRRSFREYFESTGKDVKP